MVLALAVSLDGFGVGAMYGLRKIRIPLVSVCIICCMSGLVFFVSMQIGVAASAFLPARAAGITGAVILIAIGCWAVFQMLLQNNAHEDQSDRSKAASGRTEVSGAGTENADCRTQDADAGTKNAGAGTKNAGADTQEMRSDRSDMPVLTEPKVMSIELKRLGLVIQILKTPAAADLDRSGIISPMEAAWLGLALSLDAFGAGIGAAFIGYTPLLTSLIIALSCGTFIYCGLRVGFMYSNVSWIRRLSVLPGCMLILMGFLKLM
jgi:putative Mn2+ efflux pump MntP